VLQLSNQLIIIVSLALQFLNVQLLFSSFHFYVYRSAELAFSIPSFPSSEHLPKTDYYDPQFVKDFDKYTLGKTFFDLKEFDRAAFFLDG